ncbi:hypothetical protein HDU76_005774, partial [Blyttiomyces sp. JEL0837]
IDELERVENLKKACDLKDESIGLMLLDAGIKDPWIKDRWNYGDGGEDRAISKALVRGHANIFKRLLATRGERFLSEETVVWLARLPYDIFTQHFHQHVVNPSEYAARCLVAAAYGNQPDTIRYFHSLPGVVIIWQEYIDTTKQSLSKYNSEALAVLLEFWKSAPESSRLPPFYERFSSQSDSQKLYPFQKRKFDSNYLMCLFDDEILERLLLDGRKFFPDAKMQDLKKTVECVGVLVKGMTEEETEECLFKFCWECLSRGGKGVCGFDQGKFGGGVRYFGLSVREQVLVVKDCVGTSFGLLTSS